MSTTRESASPLTIAVPLWQGSSVADAQRIEAGTAMVLEALGGGFTWGAVLLRW